jgi:hypothetical protein
MKKPKIFFNPIAGSSILSITWFPGPLGDAVEAKVGAGVGFFAHNGDLLSVQFDDVEESHDHQILEFDRHRVEVTVNKGKISYSMTELPSSKRASRGSKKRSKSAA